MFWVVTAITVAAITGLVGFFRYKRWSEPDEESSPPELLPRRASQASRRSNRLASSLRRWWRTQHVSATIAVEGREKETYKPRA